MSTEKDLVVGVVEIADNEATSRRVDEVETVHGEEGERRAREPDKEAENRVESLGALPPLRGGQEPEKLEVAEEHEKEVEGDCRHVGGGGVKIIYC